MLTLSKKTDYALIALSYLAERPMRVIPAREISEHYNLPPALLVNILKTLHHARLVHSERGTHGGYQMSFDPDRISLYDLIAIVDRPVKITDCSELPEGCKDAACRIVGACPIEIPLKSLHLRLVKFLRDTKLADLIVSGRKPERIIDPNLMTTNGQPPACCGGAAALAADDAAPQS